jgi:ankyrin repeat protein
MKNVLRSNAVGALVVAGLLLLLPPESPVADAAMQGDVETVRSLVKQGADVNAAQGDGMTALHWAAYKGDAEMVGLLVYAGANTEALTRLGDYTPLHLASEQGRTAAVKALLAAGANAKAETSTGAVTPLHFAAGTGDVEAISALIAAGANVNAAETQWGHTPLMFAAGRNRPEAIATLLQAGAEPDMTASVIDLAQREREDRAAQAKRDHLMYGEELSEPEPEPEYPSDPALRPWTYAQKVGGYGGHTALTLAARDGNVESVMALLEGGADINQVEAGQGNSPLLVATLNGWFDLALMLLEKGADPNLVAHNGNNPLFSTLNIWWAPTSPPPLPAYVLGQDAHYLEVLEALLKAGANPNARLKWDLWHVEMGPGTAAQLELDWMGATPFFRAAHALDVAAMKLLVSYGADPHIPTLKPFVRERNNGAGRNRDDAGPAVDPSGLPPVPDGGPGIYPIHAATGTSHGSGRQGNAVRHVPNGWMAAVRYLVEEHGADVNARDFVGDTPLHNAAFRGDNELVLYLIEKGADVMAVNRDGVTTVDKANSPVQRAEPHPETIKILEDLGAKNNHNCMAC